MSLSAGALLGEPRGGANFLGIRKDMGSRAQRTDITLRWGPCWGICRGLICWGLEKTLETGTFLHRGPIKNRGGGSTHR